MANVEALLADTQTLLARLQEGDPAGADDDTFFAADPSRSLHMRRPSPEPGAGPSAAQPGSALPASVTGRPEEEEAIEVVYEFQVWSPLPVLPSQPAHVCSGETLVSSS